MPEKIKGKHGGARPGAGRKRKAVTMAAAEQQTVKRVEDATATASRPDIAPADLLQKAYRTLEDVMDNSPFPAPRVTASRVVIELARGEAPAVAKGSKKAAAAAKAGAIASPGGKFAPPPPPGSVRH